MASLTFNSDDAAFIVVGIARGEWHYWDAKQSRAIPLVDVRDPPGYLDLMTFDGGFRIRDLPFASGHIKLFKKESRPDFFINARGAATFNEPDISKFDYDAPFMVIEFTLTDECWFNWTYVEHLSCCFKAVVECGDRRNAFEVTPSMKEGLRKELEDHGLTNLIRGKWLLSPKSDPAASAKVMASVYNKYIQKAWAKLAEQSVTFDGNLTGRVEECGEFVVRDSSKNEYERFPKPNYRQFIMNEPGRKLRGKSMVSRFFCMLIRELWAEREPLKVPKDQWFKLMPQGEHPHPWAAAIARYFPTGYGFPYGELCEDKVLMAHQNVSITFCFCDEGVASVWNEVTDASANHCWNPDVICTDQHGSYKSRDRAKWLMENKGLSQKEAQGQVIEEFPEVFPVAHTPASTTNQQWDPNVICKDQHGSHKAEDRARWLMENKGLSVKKAQEQVIKEFPRVFSVQSKEMGLQPRFVADPDPAYLVWSDEFLVEGSPDTSKWSYDIGTGSNGWGNNELQHYTNRRENVFVPNSVLNIRAVREEYKESAYTSARMVSRNLGNWRFGRFRAKARLSQCTARGTWPAIWMLPTSWAYGGWPKSGEIDIMEHVGYDEGKIHSSIYTKYFNHMKSTQKSGSHTINVTDWHVYETIWTADKIQFAVDNLVYFELTKDPSWGWEEWPFDKDFFLLMNVAVGGNWGGRGGVDSAAFEGNGQIMQVDWVRAYVA